MKLPLLMKNECIIPVCYAYDYGYFEKYNFPIELDFHQGIWNDNDLFVNGDVPCVRGDYSRYLGFIAQGIEPEINYTFSRDFQLFSRYEIEDLSKINNMSCLMSIGTSVDFYLELFCANNNLSVEKINVKDIDTRYDQFIAGIGDLIMVPEPFASKLRNKGFYLLHDIRETDVNIKVYMWNKQYIKENPDVPRQLMEIINQATIDFNNLDDFTQYNYLIQYDMLESKEEFTHREYELNLPITAKSLKLAKDWFEKKGNYDNK